MKIYLAALHLFHVYGRTDDRDRRVSPPPPYIVCHLPCFPVNVPSVSFSFPTCHPHLVSHLSLIQSFTLFSPLSLSLLVPPVSISFILTPSFSFSTSTIYLSQSLTLLSLSFSPSDPYISFALIQSLSPLHFSRSHSVLQSLTLLSLSFSLSFSL